MKKAVLPILFIMVAGVFASGCIQGDNTPKSVSVLIYVHEHGKVKYVENSGRIVPGELNITIKKAIELSADFKNASLKLYKVPVNVTFKVRTKNGTINVLNDGKCGAKKTEYIYVARIPVYGFYSQRTKAVYSFSYVEPFKITKPFKDYYHKQMFNHTIEKPIAYLYIIIPPEMDDGNNILPGGCIEEDFSIGEYNNHIPVYLVYVVNGKVMDELKAKYFYGYFPYERLKYKPGKLNILIDASIHKKGKIMNEYGFTEENWVFLLDILNPPLKTLKGHIDKKSYDEISVGSGKIYNFVSNALERSHIYIDECIEAGQTKTDEYIGIGNTTVEPKGVIKAVYLSG